MSSFSRFLPWFISICLVGFLVALPLGTQSQLVLGVVLIGALLVVWRLWPGPNQRLMMMSIGTLLVLRYLYWRATSTLPSTSDMADFIPGMILFAAELFCIGMLFISLFVVASPLERKPARRLTDAELPTVDVFIPTYNEDVHLLSATLAAARALDYPADKLKVYLLDDGGTDQKCTQENLVEAAGARRRRAELMSLCADLGATYLTRQRNVSAKAGNLNNGLAHSTGELVVVFDADHAPVREFLRETVGHFRDDPRLFLVQTPHFFLNPDPVEKNLSTWLRMPSENEMFYSVIQRGLDRWNAAFFCGSAAVLRRAALVEAGGFSGVSITEDCETALELHSRGWNSRYVDRPMIAGLQPETFASFIGQRSRWCRGMMQILLLKNPLFKRGLSVPQRICYLSSALFWAFPFPRLTFLVAPLLFIFFDLKIFIANSQEFVAYAVTYLVANMILQNYLYGRVRWPWVSELYEYIQSFYLAPAMLSVLLNPKKPSFNVTEKGVTTNRDFLSSLATPYFVCFAVLVVAMGYAGWRYATQTLDNDLLVVVCIWNALNLALAAVSLGVVSERSERRRNQRLAVNRGGRLDLHGGSLQVQIQDASTTGARVKLLTPGIDLPEGEGLPVGRLHVETLDGQSVTGGIPVIVRRTISEPDSLAIGLQYLKPAPQHYTIIAELMYGQGKPLSDFWNLRRAGKGLLRGTLMFLRMSLRQMVRGLQFGWLALGQTRPDEPEPSALQQRKPDTGGSVTPFKTAEG